jgi:hypothetical protein
LPEALLLYRDPALSALVALQMVWLVSLQLTIRRKPRE